MDRERDRGDRERRDRERWDRERWDSRYGVDSRDSKDGRRDDKRGRKGKGKGKDGRGKGDGSDREIMSILGTVLSEAGGRLLLKDLCAVDTVRETRAVGNVVRLMQRHSEYFSLEDVPDEDRSQPPNT